MASTTLLAMISTTLIFCYTFLRRQKKLPPGPKGHFFVGNISALMLQGMERVKIYKKWFEEYGSVVHFQALGRHMIVLNTAQAASDLMKKRAGLYSNRPWSTMYHELVGNDWNFSFSSGKIHREKRSLALRYFFSHLGGWQDIQVQSCETLLRNLYSQPNDWVKFIRLNVTSSVLQIAYGHEVTHTDDYLLKINQEVLQVPRNFPYLVDSLPFLKYYPSWLPGGQFHKDAAEARAINTRVRNIPFNIVRKEMSAGIARPSFVSTLLSQLPPDEDTDHSHRVAVIRDTAATLYSAATDSMVSSMHTFFAGMVLHPEAQRQAQVELDAVLGQDRLPTFDDRSSLPIIDCIILEVLRWNVITPFGICHVSTKEDEYLGYQIPKGSLVYGNVWAILRDPMVFPDPERFDPFRFIAETEGSGIARTTIESTVFGWGRRACPARHVALSELFIMISSILTCFEICKPVDNAGNEYEPVVEFDAHASIRRARPVPCTIRVRRPGSIVNLEH